MDKKYILKTILLNTAWVAWIALSVFLGYVIYAKAFDDQPVVIIPFSLLFLAAGGAAAFFVYKVIKKRRTVKSPDVKAEAALPDNEGVELPEDKNADTESEE